MEEQSPLSSEESEDYDISPTQVQLESVIGEGATATVWLATYNGEPVAVKEIRQVDGIGIRADTLQSVQRELRVLSEVRHPNILRFMGIVEDPSNLRFVLEFCHGGHLFDLLHFRPELDLSWWQRIKILADTTSAQAYLHGFDPPILHRDLKSLNLLLKHPVDCEDDEPFIKLSDFGFARVQERSMTQCVGTRHWMAPEVHNSTEYTIKADVFSFAMVAYEVCFRRVPFEHIDPHNVQKEITQGSRPDLSGRTDSEEVPVQLLDMIARCWAQKPSARPSFAQVHREVLAVELPTSI